MATRTQASRQPSPQSPTFRACLGWLARIGYTAYGLVYLTTGCVAAWAAVGGRQAPTSIEGAFRGLREQPFGPWALATIGVGLVSYQPVDKVADH